MNFSYWQSGSEWAADFLSCLDRFIIIQLLLIYQYLLFVAPGTGWGALSAFFFPFFPFCLFHSLSRSLQLDFSLPSAEGTLPLFPSFPCFVLFLSIHNPFSLILYWFFSFHYKHVPLSFKFSSSCQCFSSTQTPHVSVQDIRAHNINRGGVCVCMATCFFSPFLSN